jgi:hypothetical protein
MSIESLNSGEQSQPENDPQMEALVGRMKQVMEDTSVEGTSQERLLAQTEKSINKHFSDDPEAFIDYTAWLEEAKDIPDDELAREAAERWHETVIGGFGAKEVEARERSYLREEATLIKEDNPIYYTLEEDDKLALHVQSARTLSTVEKVRALKESFGELATQLQTKEELVNVKEITATSWIVAKNPRLMKRLGFTVDDLTSEEARPNDIDNPDKEVGRAHISVEDFLKQHTDKPKKKS